MTDDPIRPHIEEYEDLPEPVESSIGVETMSDSVVVRAVRLASPVLDATGRPIPLGGLIFTFANSSTKEDRPPVTFIATPEILRNLSRVVRDTANRAANLAEGKR